MFLLYHRWLGRVRIYLFSLYIIILSTYQWETDMCHWLNRLLLISLNICWFYGRTNYYVEHWQCHMFTNNLKFIYCLKFDILDYFKKFVREILRVFRLHNILFSIMKSSETFLFRYLLSLRISKSVLSMKNYWKPLSFFVYKYTKMVQCVLV